MALAGRSMQGMAADEVRPAAEIAAVGGLRFDALAIALCAWLIGGVHLDGWAHNHIPQLETFFTPWHAVLYSGYLATALLVAGATVTNHRRGLAWRSAPPAGYGLALAGSAIFAVGGVLDMLWHELFGIEASVAALLSPTHLMLATGGTLVLTGPLRAAWTRPASRLGWRDGLPALLSATFALAVLAFFTQFLHPFVDTWAARGARAPSAYFDETLGIASILLQAGLLTGTLLFLVRRWTLPFGAVALVTTVNGVLISFMNDTYALIPVAALGGLAVDLLIAGLRPSLERRAGLRGFAFAAPLVFELIYFLSLMARGGIRWTIHLWLGSAVMAGVLGLLLSLLVLPPQIPGEAAPAVDGS